MPAHVTRPRSHPHRRGVAPDVARRMWRVERDADAAHGTRRPNGGVETTAPKRRRRNDGARNDGARNDGARNDGAQTTAPKRRRPKRRRPNGASEHRPPSSRPDIRPTRRHWARTGANRRRNGGGDMPSRGRARGPAPTGARFWGRFFVGGRHAIHASRDPEKSRITPTRTAASHPVPGTSQLT